EGSPRTVAPWTARGARCPSRSAMSSRRRTSSSSTGPTSCACGSRPWTFSRTCVCPRRKSTKSEEHTSELQSRGHLVCRLLLEKKKKKSRARYPSHDSHYDIKRFYVTRE